MEVTENRTSWRIKGHIGPIRYDFNPVVTVLSAIIIWSFVIWCIVEPQPAKAELSLWMLWVTKTWTWLYIGTQDAWSIFIIVIYFSKYSKIKLGKPDDKPEYGDATYFTMLFAAGIGIGLFYFGVAEPMWHYEPGQYGNRYFDRYSDNQRAQDAINVTLFHWGIHGWIVYVVVGLLLAYMSYNRGLPMTMRSCFYPLLGDRIFGVLGDAVDILSIVATMFGVCTSLGIGAIQFNGGLRRLNKNIQATIQNQILIIWGITVLATVSVVSGIKIGIRRLSEICFGLGMFIMLFVLFYGDTWYFLNVYVQSVGYYIQWIIQLGFHTDAFAQIGNAPDGREAPGWMNDWTIFYWGWWIAWSPFVGMFIAKISKGRTIKQFINSTLTLPIIYVFLWFAIMGGAGIKMERNAALAGVTCNSTLGGTGSLEAYHNMFRLSCRGKDEMWFDLIRSYGDTTGFKDFMSIISLVAILFYFVTSSDSGSLVIDCLAANGNPDPPVIQRIFWAFTEGACASVLLKAGGTDALTALQSLSIVTGLAYTMLLNLMCVALWRAFKMECGDLDPNGPSFASGLLDTMFSPTLKRTTRFLIAIFAPWYFMGKAASKLYGGRAWIQMLVLAIPFNLWILLMILQVVEEGLMYVGWSVLFGFFAYGTGIRADMRDKYNINGNMFEDFFAMLLTYPFAVVQMDEHMEIQVILQNGDAEVGKHQNGTYGAQRNGGYVRKSIESYGMPEKRFPEYSEPSMVHQRAGKSEKDGQSPDYAEHTFL